MTSCGTLCSLAPRTHAWSATAQLGHIGRPTLAKAQHKTDRFRAMASEILRKNKNKRKRVDKPHRLRRYLGKRNSASNLAASNRPIKPEQRHHRPAAGTSTSS